MKKPILIFAVTALCLVSGPTSAQMTSPPKAAVESADAARDKIAADYKAARALCDAMRDNAKDVCVEEAKGKEKIAKAELEQQRHPSESNARKVAEAKVEVAYDVAKEKCDDLKGDAKDACVKQAKADEAKGKAEIKAMK
ncbi:hypothetical protein AB4Z46_33865 [Variovorax sp. M-6]|uniref:hypothetical protein n=1 Tax=Variovorax sp. M-6 TaxID=3233041 RepID=UPI003F9E51DF